MPFLTKHFLEYINKIPWQVYTIWLFSVVLLGGLSIWRYEWLLDPNYDLGIFHQVVWNTLHGRFFIGSFNEWTYLVDHRAWLLLIAVPFYMFWSSPIALLVLQVVIVGSGVLPVYLIMKHLSRDNVLISSRSLAIGASIVYICNPSVIQTQLYEFHVLPWIFPLALWLWYSVLKEKRLWFWIVAILCLLLREDVALMLFGVSALLLMTQLRRWRVDAVILMLVSVLWFAGMVLLGGALSQNDSPLFMIVYSWMGDSLPAVMSYMITHPFGVLAHIFQPYFFIFFAFFVCTTGVFAIVRPVYAIPAFFSWVIYGLMTTGTITTMLMFHHYSNPMVVWFMIAAMHGVSSVYEEKEEKNKKRFLFFSQQDIRQFTVPFIGIATFVGFFLFGPHWIALQTARASHEDHNGMREFAQSIPQEDRVYAGNRYWAHVGNREGLFPLQPLLLGVEHLTSNPVKVKEDIDWLFIENTAFQYAFNRSLEERRSAANRLLSIIQVNELQPVRLDETGVVFGPMEQFNQDAEPIEYNAARYRLPEPAFVSQDIIVIAYEYDPQKKQLFVTYQKTSDALNASLQDASGLEHDGDDLFTSFTWEQGFPFKKITTQPTPIGYGVWLPSFWQKDTPVTIRYTFDWPDKQELILLEVGTLHYHGGQVPLLNEYRITPLVGVTGKIASFIELHYSCAVSSNSVAGDDSVDVVSDEPSCIE